MLYTARDHVTLFKLVKVYNVMWLAVSTKRRCLVTIGCAESAFVSFGDCMCRLDNNIAPTENYFHTTYIIMIWSWKPTASLVTRHPFPLGWLPFNAIMNGWCCHYNNNYSFPCTALSVWCPGYASCSGWYMQHQFAWYGDTCYLLNSHQPKLQHSNHCDFTRK